MLTLHSGPACPALHPSGCSASIARVIFSLLFFFSLPPRGGPPCLPLQHHLPAEARHHAPPCSAAVVAVLKGTLAIALGFFILGGVGPKGASPVFIIGICFNCLGGFW